MCCTYPKTLINAGRISLNSLRLVYCFGRMHGRAC